MALLSEIGRAALQEIKNRRRGRAGGEPGLRTQRLLRYLTAFSDVTGVPTGWAENFWPVIANGP